MKLAIFLLALSSSVLWGQSCAITSPAASSTQTAWDGFAISGTLTSLPAAYKAQVYHDTYPAYNPGFGPLSVVGVQILAPGASLFSVPANTLWYSNENPSLWTVNILDALNTVLCTSTVSFNIANAYPLSYVPSLSVSVSQALTSVSGNFTVTTTMSGTGVGTNLLDYTAFIDGIQQASVTQISGTWAVLLDSTQFINGPHILSIEVMDCAAGKQYSVGATCGHGRYNGTAGEWSRTATFANGAVASQPLLNYSKLYVAPSATITLTAQQLNTDGTTSATTPAFMMDGYDTSLATVGVSSGLVTMASSFPQGLPWSTSVDVMIPTITGTNLAVDGTVSGVFATGFIFPPNLSNAIIQITGGTGWTVGTYFANGTSGTNFITLACNGVGQPACPAMLGATGGHFSIGPTRKISLFGTPTNQVSCLGSDGNVHANYDPNCVVMNEMFASIGLINGGDQPYNPGAVTDLSNSPINTVELGTNCALCSVTDSSPSSGTSYTNWQTNLTSYISQNVAFLGGKNNLYFYGIGTAMFFDPSPLWSEEVGPCSTVSPTCYQYMHQSWASTLHANNTRIMLGINPLDEGTANGLGATPLQGPINFTTTNTTQNWLFGGNVHCVSALCTVTVGNPAATVPYALQFQNQFVVTGSTVTNMNSVAPAFYTGTPSGNNFTFTATGVPDGTYNLSTDPGFTIQTTFYAHWVNSNTSYPPYNGFALLKAQQLAATASVPTTLGAIGTTPCYGFANWQGNGNQSIGSITQWGQYSDLYVEVGAFNFLPSRFSAYKLLSDPGNVAGFLRSRWGCYNPALPLLAITPATMNYVGLSQIAATVVSASGNSIVLSATAPNSLSLLKNIIPGIDRLFITGGTNTGSPNNSINGNFYIDSCSSVTVTLATCTVLMGGADFAVSGTGGTATYQDATTKTLTDITTAINGNGVSNCAQTQTITSGYNGVGGANLCGDYFDYSSTWDATQYRKRGQTVTFSGVTGSATSNANCLNAPCNLTRTFKVLSENLNLTSTPVCSGGNCNRLWIREVPVLSCTSCGSATVIPSNLYVRGITPYVGLGGSNGDLNPEWTYLGSRACMVSGCMGERIYQVTPYLNGYTDQRGFTGTFTAGQNQRFTDGNTVGQEPANLHLESAQARPLFEAKVTDALPWHRWVKYLAQPWCNPPDLGPWIDVACHTSAVGAILSLTNFTDGPQAATLTTTPYLQSGQKFLDHTSDAYSVGPIQTITAGTTSIPISLGADQGMDVIFPATFTGELQQPTIALNLADGGASATDVVINYTYSPYYLPLTLTSVDCGGGTGGKVTCTLPVDLNFGQVVGARLYYQVLYRNSSGTVLNPNAGVSTL